LKASYVDRNPEFKFTPMYHNKYFLTIFFMRITIKRRAGALLIRGHLKRMPFRRLLWITQKQLFWIALFLLPVLALSVPA